MKGPRLVRELLTDRFEQRLADCWDGRQGVFTVRERAALLELAELQRELVHTQWADLLYVEREQLVAGAKLAIQFGRYCSRLAGEGGP